MRFRLLPLAVALCAAPALTTGPVAAQATDASVLVFTKTTGFRHASIPDGIAALRALGATHGFTVEASEDAGLFSDAELQRFDAVVFLNTTGDILNAQQQAAFERYLQSGGGWVGIHSAADTEYEWEWYGGLVGAYFASHPPGTQTATVEVADRVHPSTADLPLRWRRTDEWYNFRTNPRGRVHVLAALDEDSYAGGTMGHDHPIAWCHPYAGGRAWYTAGGHTSGAYAEPNFQRHLLDGIRWAAGLVEGDCRATLDASYEVTVLDDATLDPMELSVAPDGRVFFVELGGAIKVYDPAQQRTEVVGRLEVATGGEDGLLGITLDPGFEANGHVYLFYTPAATPNLQHVSRFTLSGGALDPASERVLLTFPINHEQCCHSGGSLTFGPGGDLFISTGDDTNPFASDGFTPIDERPGREPWDAQRSAANTQDLRGKILRITPQADGTYTIPEGNLFEDPAEGRPEIYIMGTRNPFRISVDPETGWLYWGDVGPDARADDPDRGPLGYDEWNRARAAGNYGWPYCIANNQAYVDYDFSTGVSGAAFSCEAPQNTSPNNDGAAALPSAQPAWIWYPYGPSERFPALGSGGRTANAGPVYHYDPALDSERKLPAYFDGALFIYEWARNAIWEVRMDPAGDLFQINPFLPSVALTRPIEMELGPDGALYVLEWGTGFGGQNNDSRLVRIAFGGGSRAPVARFTAAPPHGPLPLTVTFDAGASFDPDPGDVFTYAWDFDDDGATDATGPGPSHTFNAPGDHLVRLTLTDAAGNQGTATVTVVAGNSPPVVTFTAPPSGGFFAWGAPVPFAVQASDAEDGSTATGGIDCAALLTQPSLGHDDHAHPVEQYTGCSGTFVAPAGHGSSGDQIFLVVRTSYEDRGAGGVSSLTGEGTRLLRPMRLEAEHADVQQGVQLEDTGDSAGGGRNVGWIGHGDYLAFDPASTHGVTHFSFRVASAGAGGRIEVRANAPDGTLLGTARVVPTGGWQDYYTVVAAVEAAEATESLYFVFARNPGDNDLFNVNWIEAHGPGITPPDETASAGLAATYYRGGAFEEALLSRSDPLVSFNWGPGAPASALPADGFSVRWQGTLTPQTSGSHTFYIRSDDGARVRVDGALIIDEWMERPLQETASGPINLEAGRAYPIEVDYFERAGDARVELLWQPPGEPKDIVPAAAFRPEPAAVSAEPPSGVPDRFYATAPYPNPTAGSLRIPYGLPAPSRVRVELFDLLGRRVALLGDEARPAGRHEDAYNLPSLQAGLYYLRLTTAAGSLTRSVVVVR